MYKVIQDVPQKVHEARVFTKYKIVEKKVRPIAAPLPGDSEKAIKEVGTEPMLREGVTSYYLLKKSSSRKC